MKFIKDLGKLPTKSNPERTRHYYLVECECGKQSNMQKSDFKRRPNGKCRVCASRDIGTKHGKRFTKLYSVYHGMLYRCTNESSRDYENYGRREITVCEEWREDFSTFEKWALSSGYKKELSIDRIDNNKGYSPDNCRWAVQTIQVRNSRKLRSTNTSGYRGVSFNKRESKWIARITVKPNRFFLGRFDTALDAAKAYDKYVLDNNLEHTINGAIDEN